MGEVSSIYEFVSVQKQESAEVPQVLSQLLPRAVDVGLYRAQGELHYYRDFIVRVVLHMAEDDARAVLGTQLGDRFFDRRAELLRFELLERRFSTARHRHGRRSRALGSDRIRRALDTDGIELPATQMIDGDVVGDLEQPARELELRPVAIDVVEDLDERFLREVFGGLLVAHHPEYEREHWSLASLDQLAISVLAAFLGEDDHLLVGNVGVGLGRHERQARVR